MKFNTIFISLIFVFLVGCHSTKQDMVKKAAFQFSVCEATYNGKPLPFGKSISEWEKLFGKYSRRINWHNYVWDSLGIYLRKSEFSGMWGVATKEEPDYLCLVFVNLESQIGQAGKLEWAWTRKSYDYIVKTSEETGHALSENFKKMLKEDFEKDSVTKYKYPLKVFRDTVNVEGGIIAKDMALKEVNRYRQNAGNKGVFGYWDTDMDEKNERGSTDVKTGEFNDFDLDNKNYPCAIANKYYYLSTLRYTEGVLEYIKVQKVEKGKSIYWR